MPKKGDRSNPSIYRPITVISCLSKAFETILNRKFLKHLSSFNLLSAHQYGFRKRRFTGDLFAFLTDFWPSSLCRFSGTFAITLDISKAFHRVYYNALLSKLPSYGFYPAVCYFLFSFLSGSSIAAVVDSHCSTPKPINSGVPQCSVLSSTPFLLFLNDLLSLINCPILCWWHHSALLHVLWQASKSTGIADIKERCWRTLNPRPFYYFRLGQKKLSFLQYLKNPISSSINST